MSNYKLVIDFENDTLNYKPVGSGHGKCLKLEYSEINSNPELLDNFSQRDAYLIGTIFASRYSNSVKNIIVEPRYKLFVFLATLFVAILLVSNVLSTKLVSVFGYTVPGAMLLYPFTHIVDFIITDVYGYQNARRVIWSTIMTLVLFDIAVYVMQHLPPSEYWPYQKEFDVVFSRMLRTFIASTVGFILGFFLSSFILQKCKMKGYSTFRRIFSSLLVAEIVNSLVFCIIAFYGLWPIEQMFYCMLVSYVMDIIYELLIYKIVTKPAIDYVKRVERLDIVDWGTRFSPFIWEVKYSSENNIYKSGKTGNIHGQLA